MSNIQIIDNIEPEVLAFYQAFYSRSHLSINDRLENLHEDPAVLKKQLGKYYIGYGHQSIGDCANTTIFIEGVSLLAAKAFQDTPLYSGQESSTRYIDFSKQGFVEINPRLRQGNLLLIDFYLSSQNELFNHLLTVYDGDVEDPAYIKTLKCRTFDILRGFLPAGVKTQLSWFTSLRHAYARLVELYYHPLKEVHDVAVKIIDNLISKYPDSFSDIYVTIDNNKDFYSVYGNDVHYNNIPNDEIYDFPKNVEFTILQNSSWYHEKVTRTSRKDPIPRFLEFSPDVFFEFPLDFASARDLLRHRRGYIPLPPLDTRLGFNDWYLDQLPNMLREKAEVLLETVQASVTNSSLSNYEQQYYIPIGYNVPIIAKLGLAQIVYMIELRSSKTVHPTLRKVIHRIATIMENEYNIGKYIDLFCDFDENDFTLRRASQDIVEKKD
jgi:thymidylate synthase ThyX